MKRLIVPLAAVILGTLLFTGLLYVDFYRSLDSRFYDLLIRIKPGIQEDDSILLVEVDDQTISEVNMYPLSRDIFADGLILLKEFEPGWTILDIEFVDRSPAGINLDYLDYVLPNAVYDSMNSLMNNNADLVEGILAGSIGREAALDYLDDLYAQSSEESERLYEAVRLVAMDKDVYLGSAVDYLSDVSVTLNMTEDVDTTVPEDLRKLAEERLSVNDELTIEFSNFESAADILPSIRPVTEPAAWAGFPRMHIDPDGVRRRVDVLYENNGKYYTHMGFGTWWFRAGRPPLTVTNRGITAGDVFIPLDRDGKMLINWPKRLFDGTPLSRAAAENFDPNMATHRLSFYELYRHDILMDDLSLFIGELESYGITSDVFGETSQPLSRFAADLDGMLETMMSGGDGSRSGEYRGYRDEYLEAVASFFSEGSLDIILDELNDAMSDPELPAESAADYAYLIQRVPVIFDEIAWRVDELQTVRSELGKRIGGSTIVVGYTGTSTTDYGANPFEKRYMNMGIYGAIYNSLLQEDFLAESPLWMTAVICLIAGLAVALLGLVASERSSLNTTIGVVFVVLTLAAGGSVFVFTGFYINMLPLLLILFTTYIISQASNYLLASKERAFIQNAFGQIISPDVVKEIEKNPEMLSIKGQTRPITAMFSDIEKFSTVTEHLGSTEKLFEFLQRYLTPMSDLILEEHGTIDKYEGDAIIAFWNAPTDQEDHAHRACRCAMRMARLEKEINDDLVRQGFLDEEILSKLPHGRLFTRIGINTGNNNVGFIGTERRKDYTALGDDMNLAARLEGVNKLYGTQVAISGATEKIIHTEFITRRLDRIRVMGRDTPVSMYELSYSKEFPDDFSDVERECFNYYRDAFNFFQDKKWDEAEKLFKRVLGKLPDDGPSKVFIERCAKYRKNPPPANWDGVYKMESK
ncbi:MAG: adenylate/guanylate cyclase domain-containing protein [Spirochaetaceae bacterium]|nr:adenylate/guanylate cyclase domain-containing protein [Spirochaetaceae bacterium]